MEVEKIKYISTDLVFRAVIVHQEGSLRGGQKLKICLFIFLAVGQVQLKRKFFGRKHVITEMRHMEYNV